jgi:hypothetical protein
VLSQVTRIKDRSAAMAEAEEAGDVDEADAADDSKA